ncbi:hypothetical protein SAMD00019534_021250 [Acytostelium subglobosum LB1]|uniref:hypothetical protein n=1 Tax=Acytostelium subglobosum LB1 TaxID=1410327 RepID=UPI0006449567|nr:hypothetical protein SAMD00019534_021250 [Acytostelium subglobosum LB1]GAM18950.1 hypothetical protein SAMD00019534_021250 [Acytostelium subglobosum LB1]|eukprot:XP_012758170.1 hypothetical protein SAMD00019534_021250 [Acytostelium subglobosum LB1]
MLDSYSVEEKHITQYFLERREELQGDENREVAIVKADREKVEEYMMRLFEKLHHVNEYLIGTGLYNDDIVEQVIGQFSNNKKRHHHEILQTQLQHSIASVSATVPADPKVAPLHSALSSIKAMRDTLFKVNCNYDQNNSIANQFERHQKVPRVGVAAGSDELKSSNPVSASSAPPMSSSSSFKPVSASSTPPMSSSSSSFKPVPSSNTPPLSSSSSSFSPSLASSSSRQPDNNNNNNNNVPNVVDNNISPISSISSTINSIMSKTPGGVIRTSGSAINTTTIVRGNITTTPNSNVSLTHFTKGTRKKKRVPQLDTSQSSVTPQLPPQQQIPTPTATLSTFTSTTTNSNSTNNSTNINNTPATFTPGPLASHSPASSPALAPALSPQQQAATVVIASQPQDIKDCKHLPSDTRTLNNQFFTIGGGGVYIFDFNSNDWYLFDEFGDKDVRYYPMNSVVSSPTKIYIFGGANRSHSFISFLHQSFQWSTPMDIPLGRRGGAGISTCYDGDKYIYLTGGYFKDVYLARIDRVNVETEAFERVGELSARNCQALTFVRNKELYVVGGLNDNEERRSLLIYNIANNQSRVHIPDLGFNSSIVGSCYDGGDLVYILDDESQFYSMSLTTKDRKDLHTPLEGKLSSKYSMVHFNGDSSDPAYLNHKYIYLIGGKTYGNHLYSVFDDRWIHINDNDKVNRSFSGATETQIHAGTTR